ncbi:MAG: ABC transporter permease subunit [Pseudomonadota bacterium]
MEKSLFLRNTSFFSLLIFLQFPLFYLLFKVSWSELSFDQQLFSVFLGAFEQSFFSLLLSLFFGFLGSLGLLWTQSKLHGRWSQFLDFAILCPSFLPPLVVVLLSAVSLGFLPVGLWGIVFFHTLMNVGLVSVFFYDIFQQKIHGLVEESMVMGVGSWKTIVKGLLPSLLPDILSVGFFLFVLFFFSFSIPLLVGGAYYGGPEVFIYEKILYGGQWAQALQYSLLFFLLLIVVARFMNLRQFQSTAPRPVSKLIINFFGARYFFLIPFLPLGLLAVGFLLQFAKIDRSLLSGGLLTAARETLLFGLLTGGGLFVLMLVVSFCFVSQRKSRFLLAMVHPGWVLVAFAFLLMPGQGGFLEILKICLALSILYFPFLYRMSLHRSLEDLRNQIGVARSFPAPWHAVVFHIIWPQVFPTICFMASIAAVWACGDFGVVGVVSASGEVSGLAVEMQSLMANYRLGEAMSLLPPLLALSLIVFSIFQGISIVGRRELSKRT